MENVPDVIYMPGPVHEAPPTFAAEVALQKKSRRGSERRARPQVMFVRLTESERLELEESARMAGIEAGSFARQQALSEPETRSGTAHVTRRANSLAFRVSEEERAEIEARADQAGLTPGSYVRARALRRTVTLTTRRPPVEKTELARLLGLLGLAGSNLNQVAHQLNSDQDVPLVNTREAIAEVQAAAREIIQRLGRKAG